MQSQAMQPPPQPNPQLSPQQQQQQGLSNYPPQYEQTSSQPQAQQNPPPQPQVIYINSPSSSFCPPFDANYAGRTSHVLGGIQIAGGVLAIVFQAILTGIQSMSSYSGAGFWCGVVFIITGAFGVTAGKYKLKCVIIAYMVLAIIACFFTIGIFMGVAAGFNSDRYEMKWKHNPDYYRRYDDRYNSGEATYQNYLNTSMVFNSMMVLVGVVELVTLIWGSTLLCKAMCCCNQGQQIQGVPVQYTHGQMIIAPGTNQMQVVPQSAHAGGSHDVYPMAMAASQPAEEKQPQPDTPPPAYA